MLYWFGEMFEFDARRVESSLEFDVIKMSRMIGFIYGFMLIIEDVEGVELLIESKFLLMFFDVYVVYVLKWIDVVESYEILVYLSICLRAIIELIDMFVKVMSLVDLLIYVLCVFFIELMELMYKCVCDSYFECLLELMWEKSNVDEYVVGENGECFSVVEKVYVEEVYVVLKKCGVFVGDDVYFDSVMCGFEKF